MRLPNLKSKGASGFTLVEMAIVLVIIGIILAGVMKGRDIVRGAQVKQFSQQFAQKWGTIAQTYYDKTALVLNDGQANGGTLAANPDGAMDGDLGTNINRAADGIVARLNGVGITPCTLVKSKLQQDGIDVNGSPRPASCATGGVGTNLVQTQVEGEYTGTLNVQVDLARIDIIRGAAANIERRNCVVLYNVPTDVAIGLDTAIDGTEDGEAGSFVNLQNNAAPRTPLTALVTAVNFFTGNLAWPAATIGNSHVAAIVLDY
jgi:prepilin-type N-terminal cleavage/methylation domain-containing protein